MPNRYFVLPLAAVIGLAAGGGAQDRRSSGGQVPGAAMIVQTEAVQKELNLSDEQRKAIQELPGRVRRKFEKDFEKIRDKQEKEKRDRMREMRERFSAEFPKALAEVLNPEQQKRLKQLQIQHSAGLAFKEPEVIKSLGLTDDQQRVIEKIVYRSQEETVEAYRKHGDTAPAHKRALEIRKDFFTHVETALTDRQRAAWREMMGKPFEFPPQPPQELGDPHAVAKTVEKPDLKRGSREWIDDRVASWQPTDSERRLYQIGWADTIEQAKKLARDNQRPIFLFNYSGSIKKGRC